MKTVDERFTAKIAFHGDAGCWDWAAYVDGRGYGRFQVGGMPEYAHRVSYRLYVGPIPDGLTIDHLCRNRRCVNPDHLEPVTGPENTRRGDGGANNRGKTHCSKGHPYSGSNLSVCANRDRRCRACWRENSRKYREAKRC